MFLGLAVNKCSESCKSCLENGGFVEKNDDCINNKGLVGNNNSSQKEELLLWKSFFFSLVSCCFSKRDIFLVNCRCRWPHRGCQGKMRSRIFVKGKFLEAMEDPCL